MQNNTENSLKFGVLGPKGTFTDLASDLFAEKNTHYQIEKQFYSNIWEVFNAIKKGDAMMGIVPIENNVHGTVRETFDSLFQTDVHILYQFSLPVHHCIAIQKGTKKSQIKKIVSHQQALNQCSKYLRKHMPKGQLISFPSTGAALENLKRDKSLKKAVVCSKQAAKKYGLKILDERIEDQKSNRTWFAVLGKELNKNVKGKNIHTSIAFHFQQDSPGTLFGVFKDFNEAKINMTKIESRPTLKKWGDYIFFLDFEGNLNDAKVKRLLSKVEKKVALLKVFGSYEKIKISKTGWLLNSPNMV